MAAVMSHFSFPILPIIGMCPYAGCVNGIDNNNNNNNKENNNEL